MDVHLWARTERVDGIGIVVTVSAVPAQGASRFQQTLVEQRIFDTVAAAETGRAEMLRRAGATVIARGDRVVDVVDD